jgi:hypothetical protein
MKHSVFQEYIRMGASIIVNSANSEGIAVSRRGSSEIKPLSAVLSAALKIRYALLKLWKLPFNFLYAVMVGAN